MNLTKKPVFVKSFFIFGNRKTFRGSQLLESGFGSITEVAFEVGFSSRAYFTRCFKEKFHQLPSSFLEAEFRETASH
jgi:AraC-like DNA-binding protein